MKKRLFAGLLAAVLLLSLLPTSAFAAEETDSAASDTEQTETLWPSENTADVQNTSGTEFSPENTASNGSSFSVTDFSFYAVRSWKGSNSSQEHSEYPIQLVLVDGEYVLYAPFTGLARLGKTWDLRVEAPESYIDTFSLYYLTYRDLSGNANISNTAYSVNASSTPHTTEDGKEVQSVQTDYMSYKGVGSAEGTDFVWSETMTLTWAENGEQKTCNIHVRPYFDLESPTQFHIMNLTDKKNCALEQVDETTYKTQVVVGKETIVQLQSLDNRIAVRFNDVDRAGETLSLDTTEVGTTTYTIELSDKK